ncbi:hypothetical protein DFJ73DRAFT_825838 [Zopfochytrium polystomum]|nr:hypothetical protein DFJ73DRAFT_825838 [Zopfochytrium polystomum]
MGVLSKASLALDLSGGEHYFVPVQSAAYIRAATWIIPGTSYSDPDGVLPVFEFAESRRRAPAFNAGKQAYDEAFPGGAASPSSSAPGLSHVRGKVLLRVDAGNVGKPTVNASSLTVWLIRREPTSVGVGEPLMKQELWRADDSQGFTDLVGK